MPATALHGQSIIDSATRATAVRALLDANPPEAADAIRRGVEQVADRWWATDGDAAAFIEFCGDHFVLSSASRDSIFLRFQYVMEQVEGHLHEMNRLLLEPQDLEQGPVSTLDLALGDLTLGALTRNELYRSKTAFILLLNFPVRQLAEILRESPAWNRQTWAETRMMDRFATRVPPEVNQRVDEAFTRANSYIAGYYIRMDQLRTADNRQIFSDSLRLISHWNLRDELAAQYATGKPGLERQRMIAKVMERIVRQEIPAAAIDSPGILWNPFNNTVRATPGGPTLPAGSDQREPDLRYRALLDVFHAVREIDGFDRAMPTYVQRRFDRDRQIPEVEVRRLIERVLGSPEVKELARLIQRRLGRPLEPFDIWYSGFKPRGQFSEAELDRLTTARYPTVERFQTDLPRILVDLGFAGDDARWIAERVVVDPARGAGHAWGAERREDLAHLRTHFTPAGLDYKGYNIAIHEFGHNVEQVLSLHRGTHWWLHGVPNNAFTEALAIVFQGRDLALLGLPASDSSARSNAVLASLWAAFEIGGVGLVDLDVWNWMYAHPEATPAELREATIEIARRIWNQWYAPVLGSRDSDLLAIYSHMISDGLYLPDYFLGHIISFQVARYLAQGNFGERFTAAARQGQLTPDAWMRGATGEPLSAEALLQAARESMNPNAVPYPHRRN